MTESELQQPATSSVQETPAAPEPHVPESPAEPSAAEAPGPSVEGAASGQDRVERSRYERATRRPPDHQRADASASRPTRQERAAPPIDPASLFAPVAGDRSPAAWHARLVEAVKREAAKPQSEAGSPRTPKPEKPHATRAGGVKSTAPAPSAEPLAEATRRFLAPLAGIDPAGVQVHRDTAADELASIYHADALSAGENVFLSARFAVDGPGAAGLLAHELVHVARHREPDFVPPVVRETHVRGSASGLTPAEPAPAAGAPSMEPNTIQPAPPTDEETLAALTEARVTELARAQTEAPLSLQPHEIRMPRSARPPPPALAAVGAVSERPQARDPWGTLPAPWEPLPEWLTSSPDGGDTFGTASPPTLAVPAVHPTPLQVPSAPVTADHVSGTAVPAVQRAAVDRSLPEASGAASGDVPATGQRREPEPDLDTLAQQVHAILKRRLAAERRREG